MKFIKRRCVIILLVFSLNIFITSPIFAHGVNIFAYAEDGKIYTESYFSNGKGVINGKIEVFDNAGILVYEGYTDKNGGCIFNMPGTGDLKIVLDAGMGHSATYKLNAEELGDSYIQSDQDRSIDEEPVNESYISVNEKDLEDQKGGNENSGADHYKSELSIEDIRKVVEEEVSKQIRPLSSSIARLKKDTGLSVSKVVAGIGYIMGLMGLFLYFKSKRS
jgi:nickel transport protein